MSWDEVWETNKLTKYMLTYPPVLNTFNTQTVPNHTITNDQEIDSN